MFEPLDKGHPRRAKTDPAHEQAPAGDAEHEAQPEAADNEDPRITELKAEAERYLANWQRAQADFANYKRRTEQELAGAGDRATARLIEQLLPALDDLERVFDNAPPELDNTQWYEGLKMVYRKIQSSFQQAGLQEIEAAGTEFDPNLHDAVGTTEGQEGHVIQVFRKGYLFNGRLLRPAMVVVGKGGNNAGEPEA